MTDEARPWLEIIVAAQNAQPLSGAEAKLLMEELERAQRRANRSRDWRLETEKQRDVLRAELKALDEQTAAAIAERDQLRAQVARLAESAGGGQ